jgi:hypothetical protein
MEPSSSNTCMGGPLDVRFNDRVHTFTVTPTAAKAGRAVPNNQHVNGLLGTPLRPCMGLFTSPHVCRSRDGK